MARGWTLATAESCTGGLVAHRITNIAGASSYYLGGVVAYANQVKIELLHVDAGVLAAHGAVSEAVARQMAEGVRKRFGADVAVALTGIAGPSGGTPEKPVGLVYLAAAGTEGAIARRRQFSGSREEIKEAAASAALELLWEQIA